MTELPPLPERDDLNMRASSTHVYTADQMRAYAAEAVRVALEQAATEMSALREWNGLALISSERATGRNAGIDACIAIVKAEPGKGKYGDNPFAQASKIQPTKDRT